MEVRLLSHTALPVSVCAAAARTCYSTKTPSDLLNDAESKPLKALTVLENVMESGHESVLEHASFTFEIVGISRVCLAHLTRHRLASFSVQSQRYVACDDRPPFMPKSIDEAACKNTELFFLIGEAYKGLKKITEILRSMNVPDEDIRYLWPEGTVTNAVVTMNARELRHFLSLRMCNRAQKEIRDLAWRMRMCAEEVAPFLMNGAGPGCLRGKCPEGRKSCGNPVVLPDDDEVQD